MPLGFWRGAQGLATRNDGEPPHELELRRSEALRRLWATVCLEQQGIHRDKLWRAKPQLGGSHEVQG